jgi:hypothetical protein
VAPTASRATRCNPLHRLSAVSFPLPSSFTFSCLWTRPKYTSGKTNFENIPGFPPISQKKKGPNRPYLLDWDHFLFCNLESKFPTKQTNFVQFVPAFLAVFRRDFPEFIVLI